MHNRLARAVFCVVMFTAGAARAASAQTCIAIDQPRDTLGPDERPAALLLVGKQFELAGQRVVDGDCPEKYTLSHIRLGTTIVVTLSGPMGSRVATALGLDDLPAVYSQMVRSLITGQPMSSLAVVDRTNVSATQDRVPRRVQSDGYWHARLGYGSLFGASVHHSAVVGFGYRTEFNRLGLDVSFLNLHLNDSSSYGATSSASSLVKLEGLFFSNPTGNRSAYFGGGLSYGRAQLQTANAAGFPNSGHGGGLQGELTAGYEIARVTSVRLFAQADVTLPFYKVIFETYSFPDAPSNGRYVPPTVTIERQYLPSLAISIGLGWQRGHR